MAADRNNPPSRSGRRRQLRRLLALLIAGGARLPDVARAEDRPDSFDLTDVDAVLAALGGRPVDHPGVQFEVPPAVENGAFVPVEAGSSLPGTRAIYLLSSTNPYPLVARYDFPDGTEPYVATRIRVQGSGLIHAVVRSDLGLAWCSRPLQITVGGCDG